jgi:hypothetical protein
MSELCDSIQPRSRYGETDRMGTFYNAHAFDLVIALMNASRPGPIRGVTT